MSELNSNRREFLQTSLAAGATLADADQPSEAARTHQEGRRGLSGRRVPTFWVIGGPAGAAARLGMKRTTLQSRMRKLGIRRP